MGTGLHCEVRCRTLACKEVILVRDAGYATGTEIFVLIDDLREGGQYTFSQWSDAHGHSSCNRWRRDVEPHIQHGSGCRLKRIQRCAVVV